MKSSTLPFAFLLLAIASTPWNAAVFAVFRLNDIFLVAAFFLAAALLKISRPLIICLYAIILTTLASTLPNMNSHGTIDIERVAFLYKYSVPLLVAIAFVSTAKTHRRIALVEKFLLAALLVLVGWVYYYKSAVASGSIAGLPRVSFPGSNDFLVSDAHLYSNYLAMGLIFYALHLRRALQHSPAISVAIILTTCGALILTGSRNGIVSLFLAATIWIFLTVISGKATTRKSSLIKSVAYLSLFLASASNFYALAIDFLSDSMERAFNFDFAGDTSALSRLEKLSIAISDWESNSFLFGSGLFNASLTWYDSGLGIILAHMGLIGLCIVAGGVSFFVFVVVSRHGVRSSAARGTLTILAVYVFANGITEFALVTRNVLPAVLFILVPVVSENIRNNTGG